MNMHKSAILKSASVQQLKKLVTQGSSCVIEGLGPSAKACVTALTCDVTQKNIIILTGAGQEEFKLYNDIPFFTDKPVIEIPAWETLPQENIAPSPDIVGSRYAAFSTILHTSGPKIILTSLQSALQKVVTQESFKTLKMSLSVGDTLDFDTFVQKLIACGYERKSICSEKGEFAVRGGIIDIFTVTGLEPYRIEFWGDTVDTIRSFDPVSQKSIKQESNIEIWQSKELDLVTSKNAHLQTIFDYIGKESIVILDDLEALEDRYASLTTVSSAHSKAFMGIEELLDTLDNMQKLFLTKAKIDELSDVRLIEKKQAVKYYSKNAPPSEITFDMFQRTYKAWLWHHPIEKISTYFERECLLETEPEGEELFDCVQMLEKRHNFFFITQNETEEESFKQKLKDHGSQITDTFHFERGYLSSGFAIYDTQDVLFPMTEITHRVKVKREKMRTYYQSTAQDAFDIFPGEMVVHFNHGIGKYLGVEKQKNAAGSEQEFFIIEYAENAKLFVPLTQAHLLSKYVGAGEEKPKIHTLGTSRWKKLREQTEKAIVGYAAELLKLYAARQYKGGYAYPQDGKEIKLFEEQFPYIETEDQLQAIHQAKSDMQSPKAMDRLVLGDVGYGKTEVAMRAAFKAVKDGKKQVAVLVPTTVLAMQHYENFCDRMESFGIRIAALSRMRKGKEIKNILKALQEGEIDIIVGTHRLLQQDVLFKDLGLIIIDEEQRFGVKAKDHLKHLKVGVDCLTLSATPIPRTLYMSLVGARDLSVISTPPQDRLPIKTVIADSDDSLIQTALLRELNRDGQAYFIHNRVESIFQVADRLQKLLPKARIVIGHGQMDAEEMDLVFHAFKKGDADILIATSIVENGIDIPNANTIIVDNADHFGVADLYQLRGRVGRWNRRAYAYFLLPRRRNLSEIAKKRIEAIAQAGGYGGGMKVAMRDLEMRGAGDILGIEQSGHVSTIGFHLYCKLLKRTVDSMQGKAPSWTLETKVEIPYDARLPDSYVNDVTLRMEIYQRLGDALTLEDVDAIWTEVQDRFGKPPEPATWLYHMSRIRVYAAQRGYTHIKLENVSVLYEKKSGNHTVQNKALIGKILGPKQMEEKIIKILSSQHT